MDICFYVDPETGEPHIYRHGVSEDEVTDVIQNPGEDRTGREGARVAIGQTRGGRYLRVIYVPEPGGAFAGGHQGQTLENLIPSDSSWTL